MIGTQSFTQLVPATAPSVHAMPPLAIDASQAKRRAVSAITRLLWAEIHGRCGVRVEVPRFEVGQLREDGPAVRLLTKH